MPTRPARIALVALLVTGAAAFSGCSTASTSVTESSSTPPAAEQSVVEACDQMKTVMMTFNEDMPGITQNLINDPAGAAADLTKESDAFDAGAKAVTNPTVKPVSDAAAATLAAFAADVNAIATKAHPADSQKLVTEATDLQKAILDLAKACS